MKKVFAILAITASVVACKNGENKEAGVDSAKLKDSIAKVEAEAKAKADSAAKAATDTTKKADSTAKPAAPEAKH